MSAVGLVAGLALMAATGRVTYVTADEAFLDVGARHGLAEGQTLPLLRRQRSAGSCVVAAVTAERAVCQGAKLLVGDTVAVADPADPAPGAAQALPARPARRAAAPAAEVLAAQRATLAQIPVPSAPTVASSAAASVSTTLTLRQQAWWSSSTEGSVFARPALHLATQARLPLWIPLTAQANIAVLGDVIAPAAQRFRPDDAVEVYVWDASLSALEGPVVGGIGRFRLRHVPGSPLVDGGQLGVRLLQDRLEVGVYGGVMPDLVTIGPAAERITAGTYSSLRLEIGDAFVILPRLSAGVLASPDGKRARADVGGELQAVWRGVGFVGAAVRGGSGVTGQQGDGSVTISSASADLYLNPVSWWTFNATYRLFRGPSPDLDLKDTVPKTQASQHGSVGTSLEALPGVLLGAQAGAGLNEESGRLRAWVGPEVSLPSALGDLAGLEAGYRLETGDWPGQSGWLGTRLSLPLTWLQLRVMASELQAAFESYREVGVLILSETALTSTITLSGRLNATQGLPMSSGSYRASPTLLIGDVLFTWRL